MRTHEYYLKLNQIRQRLENQVKEAHLEFWLKNISFGFNSHLFNRPQVSVSQKMYHWTRNQFGEVFCEGATK